jgi:hypothetical protein
LGKTIRTSGKRQWVKHRKITAVKPMEYLCLDIKYLWVAAEQRFYYLLTIIDVYIPVKSLNGFYSAVSEKQMSSTCSVKYSANMVSKVFIYAVPEGNLPGIC